ncbi:cytokinin dehydrogenase 5 isoform X2 [Cryptomeria japonica]|nr:cytokinin dehydrogenase 5 isoform X2 [Cryptomeria japonica]
MENQVNWLIENRTSVLVLIFVIARLISAVGLTLDLAVCKGCLSLTMLDLEGHIDFHNTQVAATDFGNHKTALPAGVLYPRSVADVASLVTSIYKLSGGGSNLTVAARGHAHSLNGQAQAEGGIVINMGSMKGGIRVDKKGMYAEVSGGELWIELLNATLEVGLAPKSWTDYLYLTVGGTLSNAGVSGQAFRHGPQITNVYHLEVVTGKGDVLTCSKHHNAQLFHAVLGGLGQFGIITKATVALEPAPHRVKWIRVLYSDFKTFTQDQENLISRPEEGELTFDYVEGFVIVNNGGLLSNWRSSFFSPQNPVKVSSLNTTGRVLYCLEMTLNYMHENFDKVDEDVTWLLSSLHFIPGSVFMTDLSYVEFLDRVHTSEIKLQKQGLWDVPHPWLNLMVPKSKIHEFDARVFKDILRNTSSGPILIYPMNRNK